MQSKNYSFRVKGLDDEGDGSFWGYGAVYDNIDLGGDVIMPGAFTKTLQSSGGKFPLLWQHDTRQPIGTATATDSDHGLKISGRLALAVPQAQVAYSLLKEKIVKGLSIGFDTIRSTFSADGSVRQLQELKLWELSIVTFPMNESAQVLGVKSLHDAATVLRGINDADDPEVKAQLRAIAAECNRLLPPEVDNEERKALQELAAKIASYVGAQ